MWQATWFSRRNRSKDFLQIYISNEVILFLFSLFINFYFFCYFRLFFFFSFLWFFFFFFFLLLFNQCLWPLISLSLTRLSLLLDCLSNLAVSFALFRLQCHFSTSLKNGKYFHGIISKKAKTIKALSVQIFFLCYANSYLQLLRCNSAKFCKHGLLKCKRYINFAWWQVTE